MPASAQKREEVILTSSHPFPKGAPQKVYGTTAIFSGGTAIGKKLAPIAGTLGWGRQWNI